MPQEFFSNIVGYHRHLTVQPAYERVSAVDASLATYLNHRPAYPGRVNDSIDYYAKGMLIAFELDATLRLSPTGDSLDRAFRDFYQMCVGPSRRRAAGYTTDDAIVFFDRALAGLGQRLSRLVREPGGLDTESLLQQLGFGVTMEQRYRLGLVFRDSQGPKISDVLDTSPTADKGLAPDDEVTHVDGSIFTFDALRWTASQPFHVSLQVRRGHRTLSFRLTPRRSTQIGALTWNGAQAQATVIANWLGQSFAPKPGESVDLGFYENFHGIETVL